MGHWYCLYSHIYGPTEPLLFFCNLFSKISVNIQLLTYRPDDELTDEPAHEEHEPSLPSDSTVIPSEETQPPASAETPQNLIDTDDLLVKSYCR